MERIAIHKQHCETRNTSMTQGSRAFTKILAGVEDAIAYAKGDESKGRIHNP